MVIGGFCSSFTPELNFFDHERHPEKTLGIERGHCQYHQ